MAWPLVFAAVSAATAIYSGISASNTSKSNAESAQNAASWNAWSVQNQATTNNQANSMVAMFNAKSSINAASLNAEATQQVADYNSLLLQSTNAYNQELLAGELDQIFENEGLSLEYLEQRRSTTGGEVIATQASSGTTIGEGSNQDVYVDLQAQFAIEKAVLVQQYDREAASIVNAQAKGDWETQNAIVKMQYETQVGNYVNMSNAYTQAASALGSSMVSSWANTQNANNQAQTILMGGAAQASSYNNQANQQMTAGVIAGIGSAASTYAQIYQPTSTYNQTYNTGKVQHATGGYSEMGSLMA